jgi:hypothetical protein
LRSEWGRRYTIVVRTVPSWGVLGRIQEDHEDQRKPRVLIADDEDLVRSALARMLERAGFEEAKCFGDFEGGAFGLDTRLVIVARR